MPCPYNIIFGRDTALPCPLYHSGATGIDIKYQAAIGARSPLTPYLSCCCDRQPRIAAKMILGEKRAIRALKWVEGMDKLGPAYLMARESAADRVNTLRMGLMLVFMDVVVGWAIGF